MDKFQKEIISHKTGPALILAGPGSGKTFCLTHHIKFLIEDLKVPEENILVFTFTKQAAISMERRFLNLQNQKNHVWFGTFHSIFYRFLCTYSNIKFKIIDSKKRESLLEQVVDENFTVEELANYISFKKSGNTNLNYRDSSELTKSFELYNEYLDDLNLIDYDDILIKFKNLLIENPSVAKIIKKNFTHILIDEFQDINDIQYEILKLLSDPEGNVFAVGDDDQSIYGFRGASPGIMNRFKADFKNVSVYTLLNNYRSNDSIVKASQIVIKENSGRLKENMDVSLSKEDYEKFMLLSLLNQEEEIEFIKRELEKAGNKSVAILLRTNKDVVFYKNIFLSKTGDSELREEIKRTVLAYLVFLRSNLRGDFFKIMNVPDRFLIRGIFTEETVDFEELIKKSYGKKYGEELFKLNNQIKMLKKMSPLSCMITLRKIVGLEAYFIKKHEKQRSKLIKGIFDELEEIAKRYNLTEDFEIALKKEERKFISEDNTGLNLKIMTYHGAKGLEYNEVILPDLIEGKVPGRIAAMNFNVDEERRLFYVAMTRAKDKLILLTIKNEESNQLLPSRFLNNLYSSSNSSSSRYSSNLSHTASYSSSDSM